MKMMRYFLLICSCLFCMPIVLQLFPIPKQEHTPEITEEVPKIAYASYEEKTEALPPKKVLVFATHSHEAYKPIVQQTQGVVAVYNDTANIFSLQQSFVDYFSLHQLQVKPLETDIMQAMKASGATFPQAYKVARPYVKKAIEASSYDLILDVHRDSASKNTTTLVGAMSFAKVAFVVGLEHPMYEWNLAHAEALSEEMNRLQPGISRGVLKKKGAGVDGVYNQDLAKEMVLVELGGIDNTEDELMRTIAVLAEAAASVLNK